MTWGYRRYIFIENSIHGRSHCNLTSCPNQFVREEDGAPVVSSLARRKSSWTKCYNSSSNTHTHTPHTHPTSSAAAAVSSRNNVFPKTQLRKDLLLGFLNLFQLTQVYHSSTLLRSCWALLALCYSCLTHSLAHAPSVIITAVGKSPLMRVKGQHL